MRKAEKKTPDCEFWDAGCGLRVAGYEVQVVRSGEHGEKGIAHGVYRRRGCRKTSVLR